MLTYLVIPLLLLSFSLIDCSTTFHHAQNSSISPRILPTNFPLNHPNLLTSSSSNNPWNSYSVDSYLNSLALLLSMAMNNTTTYSNASSSSHSQENVFAEGEAPDHLLYIIIPLYSLVFIIGTIGNVLVILTVVTVKQMRNTTNALILHLAIANLTFILMCIPHTIYIYVAHSYNFPRLLCQVANTLMYLSAYVSIYILVLMSIDRFLGVVYAVKSAKYRTERNVHLAVIVVWLVGIIFASPNMTYYDVLLIKGTSDIWVCLFRDDSEFLNTLRRISAYGFALLGLIVPLIIIAILYGLIIRVLRANSKGKQVAKGKKRVTKMVSAVISSFIICWTPMQIYLLYTHHGELTYLFAIMAQSLAYISSCVNPILYAFLSEPFRQAFKQFLTCSKILSKHLLNGNDLEIRASRQSSSYRVIQQQSVQSNKPRKSSSMNTNNDKKTKMSLINHSQYRMSEMNSETGFMSSSVESSKYHPLSPTNTN